MATDLAPSVHHRQVTSHEFSSKMDIPIFILLLLSHTHAFGKYHPKTNTKNYKKNSSISESSSEPTEPSKQSPNQKINPNLNHYLPACYYKGSEYSENDTILIEEPCLSCTCTKATLNCSLRVCPEFPDPPPRGCVIVQKKDRCCPQLVCGKTIFSFSQ